MPHDQGDSSYFQSRQLPLLMVRLRSEPNCSPQDRPSGTQASAERNKQPAIPKLGSLEREDRNKAYIQADDPNPWSEGRSYYRTIQGIRPVAKFQAADIPHWELDWRMGSPLPNWAFATRER
ncbi:hypothetical protein D3C74_360960 [compost metagenome]